MITLNVYRLGDGVDLPVYGTSMSNCFDLSFNPTEETVKGYDVYNNAISQYITDQNQISIYPGDRLLIPTGLIFKIEHKITIESFADISRTELPLKNYSIRLHPRSGLSLKRGLVLANCEGIVDVDYQEQVYVLLTNISKIGQNIKIGERIAQAEVVCNEPFDFLVVNQKPEKHSERSAGFGSTGTN